MRPGRATSSSSPRSTSSAPSPPVRAATARSSIRRRRRLPSAPRRDFNRRPRRRPAGGRRKPNGPARPEPRGPSRIAARRSGGASRGAPSARRAAGRAAAARRPSPPGSARRSRRSAAASRRAAPGGSGAGAPARRCRGLGARRAQSSSSVAMSASDMFSPCAPIGGTTCAASATSAVRGPSSRSATWATIGQSIRRPARRRSPSTPQAAQVQRGVEGLLRHAPPAPPPAAPPPSRPRPRRAAVAVGERHQGERAARAVDLGRDARRAAASCVTEKTSAFCP